ncbi:CbiX/SirB N-terminal domain-containing protein [Natroniella sulfidigena]|uniref:sirohydrochlorin chelatase n=1 Tax=Natroniella sulfidigena TaxID=723921 RepID=UPI002009FA7E|nr:CbiX/SirB N-terminal domain-containing protein [Natroniella sulfidigena]MCK8817364.1 CbiX/SirB N-terminal domain-containing protein [Natroniella sulfidigena]
MKTGIIVLGHGSRATEASQVFAEIVDKLREKVDYDLVEGAAMELAEPSLQDSVAKIINEGAEKVVIVPLFLFPGIHIQEDIPNLIEELEAEYPEVEFKFGRNLGADDKIADILIERIEEVN